MSGQNAFAFNGTAFVPEDRNSTAAIKVRPNSSSFSGVTHAYTMSNGVPATQVWLGYPPQASITGFRNVRTGTFPSLQNSIWVDFDCESSTLIASFDIFVSIGGGSYSHVATLGAEDRTYEYGFINPDTQYTFYIKTVAATGLFVTSTASATTLTGASLVSALSSSQTTTTITVSWTVGAGVYQQFYVYSGATYLATVEATESGTDYSYQRTGLSQSTSYNFRIYGKNLNGHTSGYREANISTNTLPIPSISWEDTSSTKYSSYRVYWSGSTGVTYQPQYSSDNANWSSLGSSQSGSGTLYSDSISPNYGDDYYIRLYVTDGEVSGYTATRSVTPGRAWSYSEAGPYTETYSVTTPSSIPNGSSGASTIAWGNAESLVYTTSSSIDYRITRFRVKGTLVGSGYSVTSTSRRIAVKTASDASAVRKTDFDSASSGSWIEFGSTWDWKNWTDSTRTWGIRDNISYWDSGQARWEYSDGTANFWPSGRIAWVAETQYYVRYAISQVNTTYG